MAAAHQAPGAGRADGDARVESDDTRGVREQRIDVDLGDLRQVGGELRQAHEDLRDLRSVDRRHVAIAGHLFGNAGAGDHVPGDPHVERWQSQRPVLDQLHRLAATAEEHDRAEGRIIGEADDELDGAGPVNHGLDHDAVDARLGHIAANPRQHLGDGGGDGSRVARPRRTPPTSDLWVMSGDRIFTAMACPWSRKGAAKATPLLAVRAAAIGTVGMP